MITNKISPVLLVNIVPLADHMARNRISKICVHITVLDDRQSIFQIECIDIIYEMNRQQN